MARWGILLFPVPAPPSWLFVCTPHWPFGSSSPRGESSPGRFELRPEPNVHKHRHMLPKSVKIKRSLSQPGQEPRWKRAKANEDPPVSEQRGRRALGSRATGRRGAIWCICAEAWVLFSCCAARGLLVPPATEQRLQYASRLSLKWKNAASAWLLCTGSNLSMPPPPSQFPGLSVRRKSNFCHFPKTRVLGFYSRYFLTSKRREGGSQLSPTQEMSLLEVSLSSLPSTALFSETVGNLQNLPGALASSLGRPVEKMALGICVIQLGCLHVREFQSWLVHSGSIVPVHPSSAPLACPIFPDSGGSMHGQCFLQQSGHDRVPNTLKRPFLSGHRVP